MNSTIGGVFSAAGRRSRKRYWLIVGLLLVAGVLLGFLRRAADDSLVAALVTLPLSVLTGVVAVNNYIERLHDVGQSGWWVLACIGAFLVAILFGAFGSLVLPGLTRWVVGLAYASLVGGVIWLGFVPGHPEENRFGPPPNGLEPATMEI